MKQVIFLGFYCQIYKKPPIARIYVGDVMIDEIEIPEYCPKEYMRDGQLTYLSNSNIDEKVIERSGNFFSQHELHPKLYNKTHHLDRYWWQKEFDINRYSFQDICRVLDPNNRTKEKIFYPKIFVYIIDDEKLTAAQGRLRIEITNSDSNYMNGFMSKSTLIYLSHFYIIPHVLFENPIELTQRYVDCFSRKATADTIKNILKLYIHKVEWPFNLQNYFNLLKLDQKTNADNNVVGGNCNLEINIKKKYRIWWPEKMNIGKGFFWLNWLFIKDFVVELSDKYKQDENQRNID
jgi:hypothetical protein